LGEGLSISAITLAELEYGVANSAFPEENAVALLNFLAIIEVLPFDDACTAAYGRIRAGLKKQHMERGSHDMLIATHAKSKNCILVTSNRREFDRVPGLAVEDWMFGPEPA